MEIQHFSHKHPLTLEIMNHGNTGSISCSACRRPCVDLIYTCKECKGGYHLHKSCAELPEKIVQHPFHPSHPLPLVFDLGVEVDYACCGCGKWDQTLLYWCKACNFTLSPDCALKPTTKYEFLGPRRIKHFLHEHPLRLVDAEEDDGGSICSACEKHCSGESASYSCQECRKFKIHKSCAEQLPRAIQHPSHPQHPMILRAKDSFFDRECVACKRTDNALTYRCSMCRVEMDPKCGRATATTLI